MSTAQELELSRLRRLRLVALLEAGSLLALVGIAVPLKHLAGLPAAVSIMGPLHGAMFLLYVWMVFNTVSGDDWAPTDITRLLVAAFIPFGALLSMGVLRRKLAAAGARSSAAPQEAVP